MTLKIDRAVEGKFVVFSLSGRIQVDHLAELQRLFEMEAQDLTVILDMKEVKLVDRNAVTFLARCQADGATLKNCPAYVRQWIERQAGGK
jgi:anti-anti-sigma regulatory factor